MTPRSVHEQLAHDYLAREFGQDSPAELTLVGTFDEQPLEGEGSVTIYSFRAAREGNPAEDFHAVVGLTQPNYYPAWGLAVDDVYSLHIGTRCMLGMEIGQVQSADASPEAAQQLCESLGRVAPGEPITQIGVAAAFAIEDQHHTVYRLRLADEDLFVITGDLPMGIYRHVELPPHVVYRLHLGKIIRMEKDDAD